MFIFNKLFLKPYSIFRALIFVFIVNVRELTNAFNGKTPMKDRFSTMRECGFYSGA